ncbi:hypothetical protein OKF32_05300 [Lentilactobacillus buchneri]|nr:hypothetical protein OKF32_05300 [Lentilactobacillus sp. Egmn17]
MNILLLIIVGFIIGTVVITLGGGGAATSLVTSFPSLLIGSYSYFRLHKIKFLIFDYTKLNYGLLGG